MKDEVLSITQKILSDYHEGFIYIDNAQMRFTNLADSLVISGKFQFTGSAYLKVHSKILNNTEAMFIFNQLQYSLLAAIFIQQRKISSANLAQTYAILDGIVYKDMQFNFKRMITEEDELTYSCGAQHFNDHKGRDCFSVNLSLVNGAFLITGSAVCLDRAIHNEGFPQLN